MKPHTACWNRCVCTLVIRGWSYRSHCASTRYAACYCMLATSALRITNTIPVAPRDVWWYTGHALSEQPCSKVRYKPRWRLAHHVRSLVLSYCASRGCPDFMCWLMWCPVDMARISSSAASRLSSLSSTERCTPPSHSEPVPRLPRK